ncbi:hypothetical protein GCM10009865_32400 [Aeromicrobium ponti]|uniref:Uncharacterized protein n=1 Tax=Cytobacillus oceanisediminis TaxID=665099 RepID=A0A562JRI4_9BACI|nr:hypothetical protein [Cytobacillus oceanisediminis]TWH85738.1 hypothetical protein IQ19_03163 [Cytobacillus oceanisediminis]
MKENVWQEQQHKLGLFTEKSVSLFEIKEIHQNLLIQQAAISEEIAVAIIRNEYVKLSHLLVNRSKIQSAIKEIEFLHEDELNSHVSMNDRISKALRDAAITMESKGEDILLNVISNLDKLNKSAHSMISKATSISNKTFSRGNQLSHQAGKFLVHKTSEGLAKLSDVIQKRS